MTARAMRALGRKITTMNRGSQGADGVTTAGKALASPNRVIQNATAAMAGMMPSGRGKIAGWRSP
jgi:hypothetical protein